MAAKKLRKKDIKEDQLVTAALNASNYVQEHFTQVISGVVVLVAVVAVVLFTAQSRRNSSRDSERELAIAMAQYQSGDKGLAGTTFASLSERHGGSKAGVTALYFLAECQKDEYRYEEAIQAYDRYLEVADAVSPFREAAVIGKALCYEGLQRYAEAAKAMDELSGTMDPDDPRYVDVLFYAATFYQQGDESAKAIEFYRQVSELATGPLKDRAAVWLAVLE